MRYSAKWMKRLLEELEDALILSDIGAQTAAETIDELRERGQKAEHRDKRGAGGGLVPDPDG